VTRRKPTRIVRKPTCVTDDKGNKFWMIDGYLHRTDGPAVEWHDGTLSWWRNDKLHRTDGPAHEGANGIREWYIDGRKFNSEEEFVICKQLNLLEE